MYFKALPEIAKNVAAPLANVDKITMYGADGTSNLISNITQSIGKINDGVQDSTGIDLKSVIAGFMANGALNRLSDKKAENKESNIIIDTNEKPIKK